MIHDLNRGRDLRFVPDAKTAVVVVSISPQTAIASQHQNAEIPVSRAGSYIAQQRLCLAGVIWHGPKSSVRFEHVSILI